MIKKFNIISVIIILLSWYIVINQESKEAKLFDEFISTGDRFYNQEVYDEAIKNYKEALNIKDDNEIKEKIIMSMYNLEEYENIFKYLNNENFNEKFVKNMQRKILDRYYYNEDFKKLNQTIKKASEELREEYSKKIFHQFKTYKQEYKKINYLGSDNKLYIVSEDGEYYRLINDSSRYISPQKEKKILGIDYPSFTFIEENETKVMNESGDLISKLPYNNLYQLSSDLFVKKENGIYTYIDRTGIEKSGNYQKASNFKDGKSIVKNEIIQILNRNFSVDAELEFEDFKTDERNNAIFDEKVILKKDGKYYICDILNKKTSSAYDDIDFSNGGLIAVKKGDLWGYIDREFNLVINPQYNKANSFSAGIGVVKLKDDYIFINENNEKIYSSKNQILPFSVDGVSFIKNGEYWNMIKLVRYIND